MSNQRINARYENGVFRPLTPPDLLLEEGAEVIMTIREHLSAKEITKLAASVLEGLSEEEINAMEKIILSRRPISNSCPI